MAAIMSGGKIDQNSQLKNRFGTFEFSIRSATNAIINTEVIMPEMLMVNIRAT